MPTPSWPSPDPGPPAAPRALDAARPPGRRHRPGAARRAGLAAVADPAAGSFAGPEGADVPVGAVVFDPTASELATGRNERELTGDPTAHAEVLALRRAAAAPRRVAAGRLHPGGDPGAVHDVRGRAGAGPGRRRSSSAPGNRRPAPSGRSGTSYATAASTTGPRSTAGCSPPSAPTLLRAFFRGHLDPAASRACQARGTGGGDPQRQPAGSGGSPQASRRCAGSPRGRSAPGRA